MKREKIYVLIMIFFLFTITVGTPTAYAQNTVKNIIVMIPDGTGVTHTTLARWYKGEPLAQDEIALGLVRTFSAESAITDSAPAATAMATGFKSNDEFISVMPTIVNMPGVPKMSEADQGKPLATVMEGARLAGKATGLVVTSIIQHATPAAFSAHIKDRRNYETIAKQQIYQGIDLFLGGGKKYLLPESDGGVREDGENLIVLLKQMGYSVVENREQMLNTSADKLFGVFADDAMNHEFDRDPATEPSLAEMTKKAIENLSQKPNGFFLLVEGSNIDTASHANDPVGVISDTLAFDQAVQVALDFAKKDKNTLVLIAADHGNGGMSIGNRDTDKNYDKTNISAYITPLKKAKHTGKGIETLLNEEKSNVVEILSQYYGIDDLTEEEISLIKKCGAGKLQAVVGPMISKRAHIGWTTNGHTGEDVILYAYGPNKPSGVIDNTEFARIIAKNLGVNLNQLNNQLFIKAKPVLISLGATVQLNNKDSNNIVLEAVKGKVKMELPINTNLLSIDGNTQYMRGLTLLSEGIPYVPQEAIDAFVSKGG